MRTPHVYTNVYTRQEFFRSYENSTVIASPQFVIICKTCQTNLNYVFQHVVDNEPDLFDLRGPNGIYYEQTINHNPPVGIIQKML